MTTSNDYVLILTPHISASAAFRLPAAIKVVQDLELSYNISLVPARCWISRRPSSTEMQVFVNAMSSHEESIILPAHKIAVAPPPRNPSVVHYAFCPSRHQRHYA